MREQLKKINGDQGVFNGTYIRDGLTHNTSINITLLINIEDYKGDLLADHLWVHWEMEKPTSLKFGDIIQFEAQVKQYKKKSTILESNNEYIIDYGLFNANNTKVIGKIKNINEIVQYIDTYVPYAPIDESKVVVKDRRYIPRPEMSYIKKVKTL